MFHFRIHALTTGFHTDDFYFFVVKEREKQPHGIGSAPNGSYQGIRQTAFLPKHLLLRFLANDCLKITYHRWIRVWSRHSTNAIECVVNISNPIAQCIIHGVFQCTTAGGHRHNFGT